VLVRFHKRVQLDLNEILEKYDAISNELGDEFFAEFQIVLKKVYSSPRFFHFDSSGLRRCNFDRFPYHLLYDIQSNAIRIWVMRHNQRNPGFGLRRFKNES
jgi:hypothetical protein